MEGAIVTQQLELHYRKMKETKENDPRHTVITLEESMLEHFKEWNEVDTFLITPCKELEGLTPLKCIFRGRIDFVKGHLMYLSLGLYF